MTNLIIEAGHNHLGKLNEAYKILNYFLNSDLKNITFMCHSKEFYDHHKKKNNVNLKLDKKFFFDAIKKTHKRKKKIGLSVSSKETFNELLDLNFDFYKLLSESINNYELINSLDSKKKKIYISTGYRAKNRHISRCLKYLKKNKNIELLHTPMTYDPQELNLKRIYDLKKIFKLNVGYSNHFNDINIINVLSSYDVSSIFFYCKTKKKNFMTYPDNNHAFLFEEIDEMITKFKNYKNAHKKIKIIKKIRIFDNEIKV